MGILFWVCMLIWLLFGLFLIAGPGFGVYGPMGFNLLLFILLGLLGWKVFGPVLHN